MSVLPDQSPADAAPGEQNSADAPQFPWILFFALLVSVGMTTRTLDVLLVEDRSIDAQVTLSALRHAATPNVKVLRLRDGDEALRYLFAVGEFARRSPALPGLVLLDAEMQVVSGRCVLDVIRAHPATSGMRVVMLTTDTRPRFAEEEGFSPDGYLMQSQDFDQYCAAMELTLKRWLPRILKEHHQRAWPAVQRLTLRSV